MHSCRDTADVMFRWRSIALHNVIKSLSHIYTQQSKLTNLCCLIGCGVMSLPIQSVSFVVDSCFINSELDLWANKYYWIPLYSSREGKSFDIENREIHMKRMKIHYCFHRTCRNSLRGKAHPFLWIAELLTSTTIESRLQKVWNKMTL